MILFYNKLIIMQTKNLLIAEQYEDLENSLFNINDVNNTNLYIKKLYDIETSKILFAIYRDNNIQFSAYETYIKTMKIISIMRKTIKLLNH